MNKLNHALVFVRARTRPRDAGEIDPSQDLDLKYLKEAFRGMEVSIYALPAFNLFDFALVGALSEALVNNKIVEAKRDADNRPLFDKHYAFYGTRYVCHGEPLDHFVVPELKKSFAKLEKSEPWTKDAQRVYGMLLLDSAVTLDGIRGEVRAHLSNALEAAKCGPEYCLSSLDRMANIFKDGDGDTDFQFAPVMRHCTCWVRFYVDVKEENGWCEVRTKFDNFNRVFKQLHNGARTAICFPAIAEHSTKEFLSSEEESRAMIASRIGNDTANMLWFGFDRSRSDNPEPDFPLPIGNFVVSARPRVGKTNAALAVMNAFLKWRPKGGGLQLSPGYHGFDVVFLNLKREVADNDVKEAASAERNAQTSTEFQSVKSFCGRNGDIAFDPVLLADVAEYFRLAKQDKPFVLYTEPDGETSIKRVLSELLAKTIRPGRGILLVVDEAFRSFSPEFEAALHDLYTTIFKQWPANAVRTLLIGQEISTILKVQPKLDWILKASTLLIGTQDSDNALVNAMIGGLDKANYTAAESLDCATPDAMYKAERKEELPYKVGPVIVRPSLYGNSDCYPVPCHVKPLLFSIEERQLEPIKWWPRPKPNEN
jgi:hypothetical protein